MRPLYTVTSTSTTQAATANAVKQAYDKANHSHPYASQTEFTAHLNDETTHGIGDKATLQTTEKTSLVGAINELFTNVSDGKTLVASAVTDMGQAALGSDSFATLAAKIEAISTDADAGVGDVLAGKTFYQGGVKKTGTKINNGVKVITPGTTDQALSGSYDAGSKVVGDADLVAANILTGKDIFGVDGSAKRTATGAVTSTKSSPYTIIVDGLTFEPRLIFIIYNDASRTWITAYNSDINSNKFIYGDRSNVLTWLDLTSPYYITTSGFKLRVCNDGSSFKWVAVE